MKKSYFAYVFTALSATTMFCAIQTTSAADLSDSPSKINAGLYLASNFAQRHHDWHKANLFLDNIIESTNATPSMTERAMILALGSGDYDLARTRAQEVLQYNQNSVLAQLILIVDNFKQEDYKNVQSRLESLPNESTVEFIKPFIQGWLKAAQGKLEIKQLQNSTIQLFHAILISDYLGDYKEIEEIIDQTKEIVNIQPNELLRVGDLYAHVGLKEKALDSYQKILETEPNNLSALEKIDALNEGRTKPLFDKVDTPQAGLSKAFRDIGNLLYHENNIDMARVFANLGLATNPSSSDTKILIAQMDRDFKNYRAALKLYDSIHEDDKNFISAQQNIADIYVEMGDQEKALDTLKSLSKHDPSADTFIKIGDFQRQNSNFGLALKAYDKATKKLGGKITEDYWHLHYARGICFEQSNNWKRAEEEFKAALEYRPNNPYVLNYLGYAWADKGIHLDQSMEMIKKAVKMRPSDGYITDSLGWVLYRVGQYEQAVLILERAVELLPYDPTINDHLGDAYWQVGRKLEARFQWNRAKNHSEDAKQIEQINIKLVSGVELNKTASSE